MGGIIAIVALLMLMHRAKQLPTPSGPIVPPSLPASGFPTPSPAQQVKNASTPPAWPTARPSGLPPWPSGWTFSNPPSSGQVARAWALLPTLWARGVGAQAVEQTDGVWTTYVATWMNPTKTMKGVIAYKPKPGAVVPASTQPVANA